MFNSISGIITAKNPQTLYLENNGIEWEITVPDSCLDSFGLIGEKTKVYTWLYHKEDMMKLFGFNSENDRNVFLDLLKVDGVGPKGAIKILSNISSKELASALDEENLGVIEKVPGIGKKTAQKMMLTLKGKLTLINELPSHHPVDSKWSDVINALSNMGYDKKIAAEVLNKLALENKSELENLKTQGQKEDLLFRKAIVELAQ
jgi:Holliday junction DNA helicase RuvA